jgi:hypothetical protein
MGIILSAMAAAGDAGVQSINQNIEQQNKSDLESQKMDLETQKAKAILDAQAAIANAPADRAGVLVSASSAQDIPVQAAPVTQISRDSAHALNLPDGLSGNLESIRAQYTELASRPDATDVQRQNATDVLAQIDAQAGAQKKINQDAVVGQTRAPTSAEAMSSAYTSAIAKGDMQAAAVLKAAIPDHLITVGPDATIWDQSTQKAVFSNTAKSDRALQAERSKEAGLDGRSALDRESRERIAAGIDKDPQFIKELKTLYPNGGAEYDEALRQRINKETGINAAGGGGRSVVYNGRIIASGNEIAAALHNITSLPVGSNTGFFGTGQPDGKGILSATSAALKNELNSDQVKTYNTMWTGISRNLGTLETSGLATTGSLIASIDKLSIVPGDNGYNVQRKLAEVRQIVDAALEPKIADPSVPPQQKEFIQGVMDKVAAAVPYTHSDLTAYRASLEKNPAVTLADYAKSTVLARPAMAGPGNPPKSSAGPVIGTVDSGYKFKGGDPANQSNWEKQ